MARPSKAEAILDATESLSRQRGFSGFTIRDVAERVGVRSAAIHYHFPSKERLIVAATQRYAERFFSAIGQPVDDPTLVGFVGVFRAAAMSPESMCLCGVMASEREALPDAVGEEVQAFFERLVGWLEEALEASESNAAARHRKAVAIVSLLEGAMLTARALGDSDAFELAATLIDVVAGSASRAA